MNRDLVLFLATLRDALRPRRLTALLLLVFLPAAIGLAWRLLSPASAFVPEDVYDGLVPSLILSFSLTILSVVYATGVVSQEVEQRTIVYLLTRPVPRWRILLARFTASLIIVAATTTLSTLLLALVLFGGRLGAAGIGPDLRALVVGALAYGSVFLLLGALVPRPLIYGLLFVFGWETWVPTLPGAFARLSIMTYLRVLAVREIVPEAAGAAGGVAAGGGDAGGLGLLQAFGSAPKIAISSAQAWVVLAAVIVVGLLGAVIVFSRREYIPREDAE